VRLHSEKTQAVLSLVELLIREKYMKYLIKLIMLCGVLFVGYAQAESETGVSRSAFTTAIENKEPASELKTISNNVGSVYFFTELTGLDGHTITHRWEYKSKIMAEIPFNIGANRWRTWSSKNILPGWTGTWKVSVLDEGGNVIEQNEFEYIKVE
jgi:Protein of unknown function (DUF2914)